MFFSDDPNNEVNKGNAAPVFIKNKPKNYDYPKRKFGNRERAFLPEWFKSFPWLHYVNEKDVVLCSICRPHNLSGYLKLLNKKDGAFLTDGFSNWKKTVKKFQAQEKSKCHSEALSMEVICDTNRNVSEMISADAISEKLQNRQMLLQILETYDF